VVAKEAKPRKLAIVEREVVHRADC